MQVAGLTDKGLERSRNEDNCLAVVNGNAALLMVADGMGGHRAGNVASSLAVSVAEKFWHGFVRHKLLFRESAEAMVGRLVRDANTLILRESSGSAAHRGMGTTITVGLLHENRLTIGHVGDSRAYQISGGEIEQLTRDHSLLNELIDTGQVSPEEARNHPQRHVLTRALGVTWDPEIDFAEVKIDQDAVLLFCTDGLTGLVNDEEIKTACLGQPDPRLLAESLIELANFRGGHDNITVVAVTNIGGRPV